MDATRVSRGISVFIYAAGTFLAANMCVAQTDPGPRGGAAGAGGPIAGLTAGELDFFYNHGAPEFADVETVADGLGPRFNLDSCGGLPCAAGTRRIEPGGESASCAGGADGTGQFRAVIPGDKR